MWKLVKKIGNKKPVVDTIGTWKDCNQRKDTLTKSYRGVKVKLDIIEAEQDEEKYRKPPSGWNG